MNDTTTGSATRHTTTGLLAILATAAAQYFGLDNYLAMPLGTLVGGLLGGTIRFFGSKPK